VNFILKNVKHSITLDPTKTFQVLYPEIGLKLGLTGEFTIQLMEGSRWSEVGDSMLLEECGEHPNFQIILDSEERVF
jgi:hypothetical protein